MSHVSLSNQCETRYNKSISLLNEMRDTCNRGASRIRSPCPKVLGPVLSLSTLNNFLNSQSVVALLSP
jgi:hypothetical protein